MIYASGAVGPPGYGGVTEGNVGEQQQPAQVPGYEGSPEPIDWERTHEPNESVERPPMAPVEPGDLPLGVPVDQTE